MSREIQIPSQTAIEEIAYIEEFPNTWVRVRVKVSNLDGLEIPMQGPSVFTIDKDNLTELLSANPTWSPNKPGGTYSNEDLWYFIDKLKTPVQ
jgi:hypothetical protein